MTSHLNTARSILEAEATGIIQTAASLNESFDTVVNELLALKGKIITTGTGKSGHVARKIAATLASTGSAAFFIHPTDAGHGDLGMLACDDAILALSFSGKSPELQTMLAYANRNSIPFFLLTGNPTTPLAKAATTTLTIAIEREACPLNLAPTTSTTAMLAVGDALALTLMSSRNFTADDFASSHPSGELGRRILLTIADVMVTAKRIPCVTADATVAEAIVEMTACRLGMTAVVSDEAIGVFGTPQLQSLLANGGDIFMLRVKEVMDANPATISPDKSLEEALSILRNKKVATLLVLESDKLVGVVHIDDIKAC